MIRNDYGFDRHGPIRVEDEIIDTSKSCGVMILFSHRTLQNVNFDVSGLLGESPGRYRDTFVFVEGVEQPDAKRAGGPQTRHCRGIGNRTDV